MDEFVTLDSDFASDIFPNFSLDLFPELLEENNNLSLELSSGLDDEQPTVTEALFLSALFLKKECTCFLGN